eukprot:1140115-Pelagomonas_calceolata.AAC.7
MQSCCGREQRGNQCCNDRFYNVLDAHCQQTHARKLGGLDREGKTSRAPPFKQQTVEVRPQDLQQVAQQWRGMPPRPGYAVPCLKFPVSCVLALPERAGGAKKGREHLAVKEGYRSGRSRTLAASTSRGRRVPSSGGS